MDFRTPFVDNNLLAFPALFRLCLIDMRARKHVLDLHSNLKPQPYFRFWTWEKYTLPEDVFSDSFNAAILKNQVPAEIMEMHNG